MVKPDILRSVFNETCCWEVIFKYWWYNDMIRKVYCYIVTYCDVIYHCGDKLSYCTALLHTLHGKFSIRKCIKLFIVQTSLTHHSFSVLPTFYIVHEHSDSLHYIFSFMFWKHQLPFTLCENFMIIVLIEVVQNPPKGNKKTKKQ